MVQAAKQLDVTGNQQVSDLFLSSFHKLFKNITDYLAKLSTLKILSHTGVGLIHIKTRYHNITQDTIS